MKTTCPKCGARYDVPDSAITDYANRNSNVRRKLARILAGHGGRRSLDTMPPEARRERARQAVAAREEKRRKNRRDV